MFEVIELLIIIIGTYFFSTLIGYLIHRMLHKDWAGAFNKAHMTHHLKLYPPNDLFSNQYRDPGKDNTIFLFLPFVTTVLLLVFLFNFLGIFSLFITILISVEIIIISFIHEYIHTAFHLNKSFWHKWPKFEKLKTLHIAHHFNMKKNFGIIDFTWDNVFGTKKERKN